MGQIKILILEDVPLDAELMERELSRSGIDFSSTRVETEPDFIDGILNLKPDIILADHSLPKYDGLSALVKSQEIAPLTPFIFVSGKIGEELSVELMRAGATDYVFKNNLGKLPTAIQRALNEVNEAKERDLAIKSLHESENRLRLVTDNLQDIILQIDQKGSIVYMSSSIKNVLGIDAEETLGRDIFEFMEIIHPSDLAGESQYSLTVDSVKFNERIEFRVQDGCGGYIWLESIANPIYGDYESFEGVVFVLRDITLRKKAELELEEHRNNLEKNVEQRTQELTQTTEKLLNEIKVRQKTEKTLINSEKRLESIINGSPIPTFVIDKNHRVVYWNKALEALTQLLNNDMIGTELHWKAFYPHKRPCMVDLLIEGDLDGINEWYPTECQRSKLLDESFSSTQKFNILGQEKWIHFTASAIKDSENRIIGAVETLEDITKQRESKDRISSALAEKEVLLREIHHRVKNNLQIISSLINLQSKRLDDDEVLYIFKKNQNRIHSMAMVHEKLYQSENLTQINLSEYIQDLVRAIYRSYDLSTSDIMINIDENEILIDINTAIPLGLIINELVNNSLKHAFPNGDHGMIEVQLTKDGNRLNVIYSDNGVGLPQNMDLDKTNTLGLKLIKILTEQMNGQVDINSPCSLFNSGTSFKLDLEVKAF
jgi:two-component system sensor kinase